MSRVAAARFRERDGGPAWLDPVLVVCPRCAGSAVVHDIAPQTSRLTCPHCALVREAGGSFRELLRGVPERQGTDPRFGVELLLCTTCCGNHLLWATNEEHLTYLEAYVGATLRERAPGPSGLSWYLPAWLQLAGNRDEVMAALRRLRARLETMR